MTIARKSQSAKSDTASRPRKTHGPAISNGALPPAWPAERLPPNPFFRMISRKLSLFFFFGNAIFFRGNKPCVLTTHLEAVMNRLYRFIAFIVFLNLTLLLFLPNCTHARPPKPGSDFVWVESHVTPNGTKIPGHWKYTGPPKPGQTWVPGHQAPNGSWVEGHWEKVGPARPGATWVPGHYGPGGRWLPGHWK